MPCARPGSPSPTTTSRTSCRRSRRIGPSSSRSAIMPCSRRRGGSIWRLPRCLAASRRGRRVASHASNPRSGSRASRIPIPLDGSSCSMARATPHCASAVAKPPCPSGRAAVSASGWTPSDSLGGVRHGASDARVQSERSWYAAASERHTPAQAVAALLGLLGTRAQDACRAHAHLPALGARHAAGPQQRVGGSHRRARSAANLFSGHAWNGRGGETEISVPATGQVEVFDAPNRHDSRFIG